MPFFFFVNLPGMEKIILILQEWAVFEKGHPQGEFEDFCHYYLAKLKSRKEKRPEIKTLHPIDLNGKVARAVTRTHLSLWVYMRIALKNTPIEAIEQFMFMAALNALGECRKTDVINHAMMEISTGTGILNRLIKKKFVDERIDPKDTRSKLLTITKAGRSVLMKCFKKSAMVREILFAGLTEDDKQLIAYLLDPVHEKHAMLSVESKHKTIEEIFSEIFAKRE